MQSLATDTIAAAAVAASIWCGAAWDIHQHSHR